MIADDNDYVWQTESEIVVKTQKKARRLAGGERVWRLHRA